MDYSLIAFAALVFVTVATPGPTVILALMNGSRFGFRRASAGIAGAGLSDIALMCAAALGLGAVLAASAFWFTVVKWLGVAYLVWIGVQMIRSAGAISRVSDGRRGAGSSSRIFRKSFLVAATNPKGYLFFAAFLPQFIDLSQPLIGQYVRLAIVFVVIDVTVMAIYAALGINAMRFLQERGAMWLERSCGAAMLLLAGALALYRRA